MDRSLVPAEAWRRVKSLFHEALELPRDERAAFLERADVEPLVRDEVRALLEAHHTVGDEAASPRALAAGAQLGPYEIVAHLGAGGMGDVYRALDRRLSREVAVKVLRAAVSDEGRARLARESRAVAALSHPGVVAIHDVGEDQGVLYLVTELLPGESLRAVLRRGRPSLASALEWTRQTALALGAAHDAGVIHRDLKPENVFLLPDGRVKVLDFGLARVLPGSPAAGDHSTLSTPGLVMGTPGYLAPEQVRGQAALATADLFALGAILFELLTGTRAFSGPTPADTLVQLLERDPPPPSSLRPEVPRWLDRVVARLLSKDPASRFQSARDLAFLLAPEAQPFGPAPRPRRSRLATALVVTSLVLALGGLGFVAQRRWPAPAASVPHPRPLTFSGRDADPAVSPDGRFLAFTSERDGRRRVWIQQLDSGREAALTEGPDGGPRFSPDSSRILFTRTVGERTALYRVSLLGGEAQRVLDDAADADYAPDGAHIAFVRWREAGAQARPTLMVARADGAEARELAQLANRVRLLPRFSPDGKRIAVTGLVQQPGAPQTVVLVPLDGTPPQSLLAAHGVGLVSAVAWDGPNALLYSQAASVTGNSAGSHARIVRHEIGSGRSSTLLWSPESSLVVDRWPGRGLVYDARSSRQNLLLRSLDERAGGERAVSRGAATDRQPLVSRDGEQVIFSSNRGDNLDLWSVSLASGATRRLTDHPADDWDPALTPDGKGLLWSSNRGGSFEVWMSDADGANPRQVTRDGVDAENPSATPDGRFIVYASGAPGRTGVWRVRPDGSEPVLLARGGILPEASPDGRHVLFQSSRSPHLAVVRVARIEDGALVPFEIEARVQRRTPAVLGRAHWMPDGKSIAFLGQDEAGRTGVYVQRFAPGEDTVSTRRAVAGFLDESITESFGVGPRGDQVVIAEWEQRSQVVTALGLAP